MKKSLLLLVSFVLTTLSALAMPEKPTITFSPWTSDFTGYLYNVDAELFLTGGNFWGTRACAVYNGNTSSGNNVSYEKFLLGDAKVNGYKWEIGEEDNQTDDDEGEVACFSFANKTTSNFLAADAADGIWVDGAKTSRPTDKWFVKQNIGGNTFKLYYVNMGMFGLQKLANGDTNTYLDKEDATNTTWALVSEAVYNEVIDQLNLYYIATSLNDLVTRGKAQGIAKDWSEYETLLASDETTYDEYKVAVQALAPIVNLGDAIAEGKSLDPTHDWSEFEAVYASDETTSEDATVALTRITSYLNLYKGLTAEDIDPNHNYESFFLVYGNTEAPTADVDSALTNLNAYKSLKANIDKAKEDFPGINVAAVEAVYDQTMKTNEELAAAQAALETIIVEYKVQEATVDNPADLSEKIVNRTFDVIGDFHGWNGTGFGAGGTKSTNAEIYGKSFDTWQDIENLPGGIYMIACKGYTRYQNAEADYQAWATGKVSETKVYLKSETLGQYFSPVMHVSQDGSIDEQIGTQATTKVDYRDAEEIAHSLYCPNTMASADEYFHEDPITGGDPVHGRYYNEAFGPLTTGDVLRIGVFNSKATGSDWSIFDDFQLIYYGNGLDAYQFWGSKVAAANQVSFDNVYYGAPEKAFYEEVMTAVTTADTKEAISEAILKVDLAVDSVEGSKEAYLAYIAQCDEAEAWVSAEDRGEAYEVLKLISYLQSMAEDSEAESEFFGFPNGVANFILNRMEGKYEGKLCTADIVAETAFVKEMYEAAIRNALTDGTDLTGLIVNPGFEEPDGKGWSTDTHGGTCVSKPTSWHGGSAANWCAEAYEQKFDVYQVIDNVANGLYEVSVQAFYRTGSNQSAYDAYVADPEMTGDAKVYSYVYFNNFANPVRNVMEIQFDENLANNCWTVTGSSPAKYTLNGMASASAAFSLPDESKNFTMKVYGLVTDGTIRLGIRNTEMSGGQRWTLWDNFKLVYRAKNVDALYEVLSKTLEEYSTYVEENGDYMTSVEADLASDALDAADDALEDGTADVMYEALIALNDAYVGTQTHVATFKAEIDAYDALNSALTEYEETASEAAIDLAEYLLSDEVSGDDVIDNMGTEELQELVDAMNDAIAALKVPPYERATPDNPVNCTSVIVNNGFEEGNLNGWVNKGTVNAQTQNNTSFDGKVGEYYCERWHVNGTIDIQQTLKNMPAGVYTLTANCYSSATDCKFYANSDSVDVTDSKSYEVTFILDADVDTISIGVKWTDTGEMWSCLDEFTLQYFGADATDFEEIAADIKKASEIVAIYSADGVLKQTLQPGLNIVVYANGEVKKLYKKQ